MADITQNPPKDETTPGQSVDKRKTGDKKVVEELQEFNTKSKELRDDAKAGFRAVVEGIKAGNAEVNPKEREKTQISGFKKLTDAQQNVVDIFGDMKSSADKSQAAMAQNLSVEKGSKLENAKEQFGLWERMLLRLVGIDEDLDQLIKNTKPVKGEKSWLGKIISGLLLGGLIGFIAGVIFGFGEVLLLWLKMVGKFVKFAGKKFLTSKLMAPIVNPIKAFFTNIGTKIKGFFKGGGFITKNILNPLKNIKTQFLHGLFGKGGGVKGLKGLGRGAGTTKNIFTQAGTMLRNIKKVFSSVLFGGGAFGKKTADLAKGAKAAGQSSKGVFSIFGGVFKTIRALISPLMTGVKIGAKALIPIGRIFGRLFLPFTILMGVIDGVKGFIDGFQNTEGGMVKKIMGGVIGGLKGIINGLIMMPLDMLKSAVAWLLGKFGFDDAAEGLKSFSFQDLFSKMVDMFTSVIFAIFDWFKLLFSDPMAAIKKLASGYMDMMTGIYKWILRKILPTPDANAPWYDIPSLIAKGIPDSVYQWAGLNPETGEEIVVPDVGPPAPPEPLIPTPESKSTIGRWGDTIKGKGKEIVDPLLNMALVDKQNGAGGGPVIIGGSSVNKGGDSTIINMVGDSSAGADTLAGLRTGTGPG